MSLHEESNDNPISIVFPSNKNPRPIETNSANINESTDYPANIKKLIFELFRMGVIKTNNEYSPYDFYIVWFCKTLQNYKALVGTTLEDEFYIEITYNVDKGETYVDIYEKARHCVITDEFINNYVKD